MNLAELKKALQPKLHKIEVQGIELYIHRPTMKDAPLCTTTDSTLMYCAKDENGERIFSTDENETDLIIVGELDQVVVNEIFSKIIELVSKQTQEEEIEKK
ncbi:hypothetical protein VC636_25635 [Citrobacter freundii]|uniref:hypothetical protein n=1 Tax=Citrobacter freundii TaxID=546 RepID=UPI00292C5E3A|nr:hypothetical protein [Citrobacter freundii]MDV0678313.1 hypothetical protein [Citrobacter freundii]MDV0860701.1 hypothetical protein [Citrobacter freundii]MEB0577846.1 hypothetical protein [Citrobacter freundii]MEB0714188.1 hypothetical protein [Citrobacter freundii]